MVSYNLVNIGLGDALLPEGIYRGGGWGGGLGRGGVGVGVGGGGWGGGQWVNVKLT